MSLIINGEGWILEGRGWCGNAYSYYWRENAEARQLIADALKNAQQYESMQLWNLHFDDVKAIVEACGKEVKHFEYAPKFDTKLLASNLINLLNLMPKMETLNLHPYSSIELNHMEDKLNLPNLIALEVSSSFSVEFLDKTLPLNSITDLTVKTAQKFCAPSEKVKRCDGFDRFRHKSNESKRSLNFAQLMSLKILKLERFKLVADREFTDLLEVISALNFMGQHQSIIFKYEGSVDERLINKLFELQYGKLELYLTCSKGEFLMRLPQRLENLQKIIYEKQKIIISSCDGFENLPNLTTLKVEMDQRLNSFAKFLPALEELHLKCGRNFVEFDTGIANKNLKKLDIVIPQLTLNEVVDEILEIFVIFPNLENFSISSFNCYNTSKTSNTRALLDKNFFGKLCEVKSLRSLKLFRIGFENFTKNFPQITEKLKMLSKKLDFVEITFYMKSENEEKEDDCGIEDKVLPYQFIADDLNEYYKIECIKQNKRYQRGSSYFYLKFLGLADHGQTSH